MCKCFVGPLPDQVPYRWLAPSPIATIKVSLYSTVSALSLSLSLSPSLSPKTVDTSRKHPFPIPINLSTSSFTFLTIIKLFVLLFDILTFPFYTFITQPWAKRAASRQARARLENPANPYSAYVRAKPSFRKHYAFMAETIPEFQQLSLKLNPASQASLATRELISVTSETTASGKRLSKYNLGDYRWLTVGQVDGQIGALMRAFLAKGVTYQERVLIWADTRLEWFLCAQALWRMGAIVTTLFSTLGQEGIVFGMVETEVEHVVTTEDLLPSLLKLIDRIPRLRHVYVIQLHPGLLVSSKISQSDFDRFTGPKRKVTLTTVQQMLQIGSQITEEECAQLRNPSPDDVAVILYTSGSTGNPKGVIQTHRNFVAVVGSLLSFLSESSIIEQADEHLYYAFLPLAHSLEMAAELLFFAIGLRIGYGSPYTMTDNGTAIIPGQKGDLRLLRPTIMAAVPLILDRIRKTLTDRFERPGRVRRSTFWKPLFRYFCAYKNFWLDRGYDTPLVNRFICRKVQGQLGGKVAYMLIGGAPLSPDTQRVMRAFLNVKLLIGYGSTETCAGACITDFSDMSIGTIGAPLQGVKIRLLDWPEGGYSVHDTPYPRGEIVIGGDVITAGYFKLPTETAEGYEEVDGVKWFKMGDIGQVDERGCFQIIDRKKDLIKLQQGEYLSLGKVEAELKNFKYAENVCVYGDSLHTYLIAFLSPRIGALSKLAAEKGKTGFTLEQLCTDGDILKYVTGELADYAAECGLSRMEVPKKIALCWEEWSVQTGFLTASLKLNRRNIEKFYAKAIEQMYGNK